jgi:para-nitrobenzyl esterase
LAHGGAPQIPLIIGTTAVDIPLDFPPSVNDPYAYFGADAEKARAHYSITAAQAQALVASGHPELTVTLPLLAMGTDMTMHEPARFVAKEMTAAGNPVWLYRFTYVASSKRPAEGQTHAGELPFLFQTTAAAYGKEATDKDRQMAEQFNTYVADFVKSGDPNTTTNGASSEIALPDWPHFDPNNFNLMNFTMDNGPVYGSDPRAAGVEVVERAANAASGIEETSTVSSSENISATTGVTNSQSEGESSGEKTDMLRRELTGTVTYRQRIALPAGSVVAVQLQDVSHADAPATVLASQTITTTGQQVPIPFALVYDPTVIDPRLTYALRATITINGKLGWANSEQVPVLTHDAPVGNVEVVVEPVR